MHYLPLMGRRVRVVLVALGVSALLGGCQPKDRASGDGASGASGVAGEQGSAGKPGVSGAAGQSGSAGQQSIGPVDAARDKCEANDTRPCLEGGAKGNCATGSQHCGTDGLFSECDVAPAANDECIPGDDADCDGVANSGCGCVENTVRSCARDGKKGACAAGNQVCQAGGAWGDCSIAPLAKDDCAKPGNDDDCDGVPNTGCKCTDGETVDCEGNATGICKPGKSRCVGGTYSACEGQVGPKGRDCTSPQDNDCDGKPDNTADGTCQCAAGTKQACGAHPGLDGKGQCRAGEQTCVLGTEGATSYYGDCIGSVGPALKDSCDVSGNDGNCSGTPNDGCTCTPSAGACNDSKACTTDSCNSNSCQNIVQAGNCLIGGTCYADGAVNPSNPCRRCDAAKSATGWSDSPSSTACDDGLWCNGSDTCNGAGSCGHQFPSGNRCTGTGPCDLNTCSESSKSCFAPSTTSCSTRTEKQCATTTCGGQPQSRTVTRYCNGSASGCTGTEQAGSWTNLTKCSASQTCSGSGTCASELSCGTAWCDSSTGLCWQKGADPSSMSWNDSNTYCNNGTWGGRPDWRLPSTAEFIATYRGCQNGNKVANTALSKCKLTSDKSDVVECAACTSGSGPDTANGGCYWAASSVPTNCDNTFAFWTADKLSDGHSAWMADPREGSVHINPETSFAAGVTICVLTQ